ncbi:MAG: sulfatase-like hydrolase/transferase [Solirubrobacterales bacterium]
MKLRNLLVALSLANVSFMFTWARLIYAPPMNEYYFSAFPKTQSGIALFLNVVILGLLFFTAILLIQRSKSRRLEVIAIILAALLLANAARVFFPALKNHLLEATIPIFVLGIGLWFHRPGARIAKKAMIFVLLAFSPFLVFTFSEFVRAAVQESKAGGFQAPKSQAEYRNPADPERRVVWLIFDEVDQRLAFDERPEGFAMPELDRLGRQVFSARNAVSSEKETLDAIPALFSGQPIRKAKVISNSDLMLYPTGEQKPFQWSRGENIFSRVQQLGFNSGLVGWYHPYDRVIGSALSRCYAHPGFRPEYRPGSGILELMWGQISEQSPLFERYHQISVYRNTMAEAESLIRDRRLGLVVIHMPIPHLPWIYDAGSRRITAFRSEKNGYFDNLLLADRSFGELRKMMVSEGIWNQTVLIVSSDHAWRESRSYDGKADARVPFMVKLPGRNQGVTFEPAFDTTMTAPLIEAIFKGEVAGQAQLRQWVDAHRNR